MSVAQQQQLFILVNSKRHSSCLPQPPFPITFKIQGSAASPSRSLSAAPGTGQREIQGHPLVQTTYSHYPGNPAGMPETNTEPLSRPQRATRTLTLSPLGKNTCWKRLNEGKHRKTMLFKSVWTRWQECLARRIEEPVAACSSGGQTREVYLIFSCLNAYLSSWPSSKWARWLTPSQNDQAVLSKYLINSESVQ